MTSKKSSADVALLRPSSSSVRSLEYEMEGDDDDDDDNHDFNAQMRTRVRSAPPLAEIMVADEYYVDSVWGHQHVRGSISRNREVRITPEACSKCCAGFSLVGMLFLVSFFLDTMCHLNE